MHTQGKLICMYNICITICIIHYTYTCICIMHMHISYIRHCILHYTNIQYAQTTLRLSSAAGALLLLLLAQLLVRLPVRRLVLPRAVAHASTTAAPPQLDTRNPAVRAHACLMRRRRRRRSHRVKVLELVALQERDNVRQHRRRKPWPPPLDDRRVAQVLCEHQQQLELHVPPVA